MQPMKRNQQAVNEKLCIAGYEKEETEPERYLVVRAGQAGTTLQHVDLAQKDQHLAPGANFQVKANPNQPPGRVESATEFFGITFQVNANPNQHPGVVESESKF